MSLMTVATVVVMLAACSEESADVPQPQADQFTTAEALTEYIASIAQGAEADYRAFWALCHAENESQEQWLGFVHEWTIPQADCHKAALERFGTGIYDNPNEAGAWTLADVQLRVAGAERATVTFTSMAGERNKELDLVKVDGRWWISVGTWTRQPSFDARQVAQVARRARGLGAKLEAIAQRIRAGEFQTVEQAKAAFNEVRRAHMDPNRVANP